MRLSDEMSRHWFSLPLPLRKRWWDETEYGKREPSEDLKQAVRDAIESKEKKDDQRSEAAKSIADGEGAADVDGEAHD